MSEQHKTAPTTTEQRWRTDSTPPAEELRIRHTLPREFSAESARLRAMRADRQFVPKVLSPRMSRRRRIREG
jgi:hypothetical protein